MALVREEVGKKSGNAYAPETRIVRTPEGQCVLVVEIHAGLSAVDRPQLLAEARRRMRYAQSPASLVVTPFMVYLVAEPMTVATHPGGAPALAFRFGGEDPESPRLWDHFFGATRMLWRKAGLGDPIDGPKLASQAEVWIARLATEPRALCLEARGGVGFAHAFLSLRLPLLQSGQMSSLKGLLPEAAPS